MTPTKRRRDSVIDPKAPKPEQEKQAEDAIEQSDEALFDDDEDDERVDGTPAPPDPGGRR